MTLLRTRVAGSVGTITLANPPSNFLTSRLIAELDDLARCWEKDAAIRAIVITGTEGGAFATHYSVEELVAGFSELRALPRMLHASLQRTVRPVVRIMEWLERIPPALALLETILAKTTFRGLVSVTRINRVFRRLESMQKPVVAAINGDAMGGGYELALACDYRIMARGSGRVGLVETLIGMLPGAGGTLRLARLVGAGRAVELILDGVHMDADAAFRANLVSRVVSPEHLLTESHALARRLALRSPESVRGVKRLAHAAARLPIARGLALEAALFTACGLSAGAREGCDRYLALAAEGCTAGDALDRLRCDAP